MNNWMKNGKKNIRKALIVATQKVLVKEHIVKVERNMMSQ